MFIFGIFKMLEQSANVFLNQETNGSNAPVKQNAKVMVIYAFLRISDATDLGETAVNAMERTCVVKQHAWRTQIANHTHFAATRRQITEMARVLTTRPNVVHHQQPASKIRMSAALWALDAMREEPGTAEHATGRMFAARMVVTWFHQIHAAMAK